MFDEDEQAHESHPDDEEERQVLRDEREDFDQGRSKQAQEEKSPDGDDEVFVHGCIRQEGVNNAL